MIRAGLDSNILIYLSGVVRGPEDPAKIDRLRPLIARLAEVAAIVVPAQALGELFVVLRRAGASPEKARAIMLDIAQTYEIPPSALETVRSATDLAVDHRFQFWDALIVTAAAEAGCTLFLSEDMQDGFVTRGLTIVNPLADPPHPRLAALLS